MSTKKVSVKDKVALVSGANRGIGRAITVELLERGAKRVYAGARQPDSLDDLVEQYKDRVVPIELDVTNEQTIRKAASEITDVQILINNAGIIAPGSFSEGNIVDSLHKNLDVNVYGLTKVTDAFLSQVKSNSPSAVVNVSSMAGLANMTVIMSYSVSKAAAHSLTQGLRNELKSEDVLVSGVYPGPIDTDMTKGFEIPKDTPENVAKDVVDGIEHGKEDIFPDELSKQWGELFMKDPKEFERQAG